jgi:hypothetical protein
MGLDLIPQFVRDHYLCKEWNHAVSILHTDFPTEFAEIMDVLRRFRLKKSEMIVGGGSKSKMAGWIDGELGKHGWKEKKFETSIVIDKEVHETPTHKVDCFKNRVGLEIEWNNKDPFFDRDLNNFRLLFERGALSVGVVVTRGEDLKSAIIAPLTKRGLKPSSSYGESTTHVGKLIPRVEGGGAGGCPVLVFGITAKLFHDDVTDDEARALLKRLGDEKRAAKAEFSRKKAQVTQGNLPPEVLLDEEDEDAEE